MKEKVRESVRLNLSKVHVKKFFTIFPEETLGATVDQLLEYLIEEAEREDGTLGEVLQRMYERLQT